MNTMLDMKGKPCPIPVVEAKKALREMQPNETLTVLVDNDIAVQNLQKMAGGLGHTAASEPIENACYRVVIQVGSGNLPMPVTGELVVAIGRNRMGAGSDELGETLIKGYLYTLREMQPPPSSILFFNGGVKLTCEGSAALEDLQAMSQSGVDIRSCGACLNYYALTDKLAVGSVTNMDHISSTMARAQRLINL